MREIQVQKLTKDNFGKYGEFLDLLDESELKKKSIFQEGFFADVVALEFNQGNQPTISVCHVKKQSDNIISFLEAHQYACEGLLPIDGDVVVTGEVGLTGEIRAVSYIEKRIAECKKMGFKKIVIPKNNYAAVKDTKGIEIIPVDNLRQAINLVLRG